MLWIAAGLAGSCDCRAARPGLLPDLFMRRGILILLLVLMPIAVFAAMVMADRNFGRPGRGLNYVQRIVLPAAGRAIGLPPVEGPPDASRPLVVIDAGHGGHDPGASGDGQVEKVLTLALARALRDELLKLGGIRVALTRNEDRYLALEERSGIAHRMRAGLFISIHADSVEEGEASGATIYTLSERGTSQTAQRMADRENRSDTINGIPLGETPDSVSAILVDLSQRETQARSEEFGRLVLREAKGKLGFRERPMQSAAFVVLKSPDVPSVLFEAGYITSAADAARLGSAAGRKAFAEATARAARAYFARQSQAGR